MTSESPRMPGPLPNGQMNLKSYLPARKSTSPRLPDRILLSPVKVPDFYKLAGSWEALLDQSLLTILAQTIQKSNYFYQKKWC